jgi:hypothetical protein
MKWLLFEPVFKIRVVYKSGYTHDLEATKFSVNNGRFSWEGVPAANSPLMFGADEVAAVWQLGVRHRIKWK